MFGRKSFRNKFSLVCIFLAVLLLADLPLMLMPGGHAQAQAAPAIGWFRTFGGPNAETGRSVQQTSDGGYIVCGSKWSDETASYDIWLLKADATGNLVWDKTFGGSGDDEGFCVEQTSDGGYVLCGTRGTTSLWLIKTDNLGDPEWDINYNEAGSGTNGHAVEQTSDGGYVVTGVANGRLLLLKTDAAGQEQWSRTFGGDDSVDAGWSLQETADGGYVIAGYTQPQEAGNPSVWLIRTDSQGVKRWDKTFGGPLAAYGRSVEQTAYDKGFIIAGSVTSQGGDTDVWLIKTDSQGNMVWDSRFGDPQRNEDAYSVEETTDEGYVVAGTSSSRSQGAASVWVLKTDISGRLQWNLKLGGLGYDCAISVRQTTSEGYVITGGTESFASGSDDVLLVKISDPPNQPENVSPPDGASPCWYQESPQSPTVMLQSSDFSADDKNATHQASQWQITTTAGDYASPVFDSGTDYTDLNSISVAPNHLRFARIYYWHVRYQDNHGAWSDYSAETEFDTDLNAVGGAMANTIQLISYTIARVSSMLNLLFLAQ